MWTRHFNGLVVLGVIGTVGVMTGCNEHQQRAANENARQAGQEVGKAAKDVQHGASRAAESVRQSGHEAARGFREGAGGSGDTTSQEHKPDHAQGTPHDGEAPAPGH
ncbi:hypothetical protein [Corallococcus sp. EGB]|uniref:hypothetical protein n=1 Tax=Corallococcus sp. EGB TaxID=1521117 RepID=UPI001CBA80FC|nr:hypothetical protein [Corallococcus sp. EGB]